MKKTSFLIIGILLITGISGAYGYVFIYDIDESETPVLETEEQMQETNDTVEEEPEEPIIEDNSSFFRGLREDCVDHAGFERCWLTYVPDSTDGTKSVPLLLDLHGFGGNSYNQMNHTEMDKMAEENNAIILFPQGYGDSWNFGICCGDAKDSDINDVDFIRFLISHSQEEFPIDSNRVYLTGHSNGCAMSQALANEASDVITAVACVAMYFIGNESPSYSPIPVMEVHGFLDEIAHYSNLMATGVVFDYVLGVSDGGTSWNTGAIQNLYRWKEMNECSGSIPDRNEESIYYNIQGFTDCTNGAEVALVTIHTGTHDAYSEGLGNGGTVDTAQIAWDFMSRFSK